jgi:OOP family OmpA-OmpF porin
MTFARENSLTTVRSSALTLLVALLSSGASAQESGWYGGINLGKTSTDIASGPLRSALQAAGYATTGLAVDDKDAGWKLLGGYSFNQYLAVEGSYVDLGNFDVHATLLPAATQRGKASLHGYGIDLVGTLPLGGNFSAFGRVGLNNTRVSQSFSNSGLGAYFADRTDRGTQEKYGVGVQYRISDAFSVRAELERYGIDDNRVTDDDADMFSLGLVYRFGRRTAPVARPEVSAPPPAPPPALPVTITLAASALFDFDRSNLKPDGQAELDKLVRDLEGLTYEVIIVTGHTDRIGTRDYNLALSSRRAATVRDYLVSAGIPSGDITARGVNSDEPVTTLQQCQGPVSDALKACLQPDRRVVVEVSGTRAAE